MTDAEIMEQLRSDIASLEEERDDLLATIARKTERINMLVDQITAADGNIVKLVAAHEQEVMMLERQIAALTNHDRDTV